MAESFFSTLKTELPGTYSTHAEASRAIFEYIEIFYNRWRRHSSIGYLTTAEFEDQFNKQVLQCA